MITGPQIRAARGLGTAATSPPCLSSGYALQKACREPNSPALLFAVCSRCGEDGAGRRSRRQSGNAAIASDRETNFARSTQSFAHMALIGSARSYR